MFSSASYSHVIKRTTSEKKARKQVRFTTPADESIAAWAGASDIETPIDDSLLLSMIRLLQCCKLNDALEHALSNLNAADIPQMLVTDRKSFNTLEFDTMINLMAPSYRWIGLNCSYTIAQTLSQNSLGLVALEFSKTLEDDSTAIVTKVARTPSLGDGRT